MRDYPPRLPQPDTTTHICVIDSCPRYDEYSADTQYLLDAKWDNSDNKLFAPEPVTVYWSGKFDGNPQQYQVTFDGSNASVLGHVGHDYPKQNYADEGNDFMVAFYMDGKLTGARYSIDGDTLYAYKETHPHASIHPAMGFNIIIGEKRFCARDYGCR